MVGASYADTCVDNSITISGGTYHLDYREWDNQNLTTDGILNSEKGSLFHYAFNINGTYPISQNFSLWGQAGYWRASGSSHYDGYLQNGRLLKPYQSTTHNTFEGDNILLGLNYAYKTNCFKPFVKSVRHKWQRKLDNYTEYYNLPQTHWGIQWLIPISQKFSITPEIGWGVFNHPNIKVPFYEFNQSIKGGSRINSILGVHFSYALHNRFDIVMKIDRSKWHLQESYIDAATGLQLPPSNTTLYRVLLGLRMNY